MKKDLLSRYERSPEGEILVDVSATKAEDLFSTFDRSAPYVRRDLEQDLVEHLIGCAREVGAEPFRIRFTFVTPCGEEVQSRIKRSVNNFFLYLAEVERQKIIRMFRRSSMFFFLGITILFISVWLEQHMGAIRSVLGNVLSQGISVAAWVSLWEALATFLIEWLPCRRDIKIYLRLAAAETIFRSL